MNLLPEGTKVAYIGDPENKDYLIELPDGQKIEILKENEFVFEHEQQNSHRNLDTQ